MIGGFYALFIKDKILEYHRHNNNANVLLGELQILFMPKIHEAVKKRNLHELEILSQMFPKSDYNTLIQKEIDQIISKQLDN